MYYDLQRHYGQSFGTAIKHKFANETSQVKFEAGLQKDDISAQVFYQTLQWNPRPGALVIITSFFLSGQRSSSLAHIITFCHHNRIILQTSHREYPLQESSNRSSSTTATAAGAIASCKRPTSKQEHQGCEEARNRSHYYPSTSLQLHRHGMYVPGEAKLVSAMRYAEVQTRNSILRQLVTTPLVD